MARIPTLTPRSRTAMLTSHTLAALSLGVLLAPAQAFGQSQQPQPPQTTVAPVNNDQKAEARWRFDRGLKLYEQSDFAGALIEFRRSYDLTGHPLVLYNIGLVQAKLGDSAASVTTLGQLLESPPASLGPNELELARSTYEQHKSRVGTVEVKTNVEKAMIQLDNVNVAETPADPLQVNAGSHVLAVFAPGYEPQRRSVEVAGQAREVIQVELQPTEQALAHLQVTSVIPDIQVFSGDELIGSTPFVSSVAFRPGVHQLRFQRNGYQSKEQTVSLHPGSSGTLEIELQPSLQSGTTGALSLDISEPHPVVFVDGQLRTDAKGALQLPLGRHHLRVQHGGYFDVERDVEVRAGNSRVHIELFPTSQTMSDYVRDANRTRTLSWLSLGAGGLLLAGSTGFLVWNSGEESDAKQAFDERTEEIQDSAAGACTSRACELEVQGLLDDLNEVRDRNVWGYVGLGVGGAAVVTGIVLRVIGDDPDKYDADDDVLGGVQLGPGGVGFRGHF